MIRVLQKHGIPGFAVLIALGNVLLIWAYRFLPLYDYPIWLYEVHLLRESAQPWVSQYYEFVSFPVPNLGLVGLVWILSFIVPIEIAGKMFLTLCVVGLPWGFWYCIRTLSKGEDSVAAFFGFPFAFNVFFYGGQAFLLGCVVLMFVIAYFVQRLDRVNKATWVMLSLFLFILYLIHAIAFVLAVVVLSGIVSSSDTRQKALPAFAVSLLPAVICLLWYSMSSNDMFGTELKWSVWGIAQNVLKSPLLFVKSYSIRTPLPLTLLNALWLLGLALFVSVLLRSAQRQGVLDKRFLLPIAVSVLMMFLLPETLFGVYRPGSRFGFPIVFLILMTAARAVISVRWRMLALLVATTVVIYNAFYFSQVNRQMEELYNDLRVSVPREATFCMVRLDWPPERNIRDGAASSIDPLFGGVYYDQLQKEGRGWIFGTSVLRIRAEHVNLQPTLSGDTPIDHAHSFLRSVHVSAPFTHIVLVGSNGAAMLTDSLKERGFAASVQKEHWTILESRNDTK